MIPETKITVNNNIFLLRFSAKTITNIEKSLGKPFTTALSDFGGDIPMEILSMFFQESVRTNEGKPVTPDQLDEILDSISISELVEFVTEGFNAAYEKKVIEGESKKGN